jgi:hypothetical protein
MSHDMALEYIQNSVKMFAVLRSIVLHAFQNGRPKKSEWADLWSYAPPSFLSVKETR